MQEQTRLLIFWNLLTIYNHRYWSHHFRSIILFNRGDPMLVKIYTNFVSVINMMQINFAIL